MCGCAPAAGTQSAATQTSSAPTPPKRLNTDRCPPERGHHAAQSLLERDPGVPPEDLLRPGDVRLSLLRIVDGQRLEEDLALRSADAKDGLRELEQRELVRIA